MHTVEKKNLVVRYMDESTFDSVLPQKQETVGALSTSQPVPMSNVEQSVIAIAIALVLIFASSAAAMLK